MYQTIYKDSVIADVAIPGRTEDQAMTMSS